MQLLTALATATMGQTLVRSASTSYSTTATNSLETDAGSNTTSPVLRAAVSSELKAWNRTVHGPDTKTNCAIFAQGVADQYNPGGFCPAAALRPVAEETKARYTVIAGGGDGAGMSARVTIASLSAFYGCDATYFDPNEKGPNQHARIVQVALSTDKSTRDAQLERLRSSIDQKDFEIVCEKWPETDSRHLRDGRNGEREQQGVLFHAVIRPKESSVFKETAKKVGAIISTFNIQEKRRNLSESNYHPAVIFGVSKDQIICKSFKGDSIPEVFTFLKELKVVDLFFHGREATNTGPQLLSMHPMTEVVATSLEGDTQLEEIILKHNGEINNIKSLRLLLSNNDTFKDFISWKESESSVALFDVLNNFSDTAIITKYIAFCVWKGESVVDVLRRVFVPDRVGQNGSFIAEGPAFIVIKEGSGKVFIARDPQGQRPGNLEVARDKNGDIIAYKLGSIPGIKTPLDEQQNFKWEMLDLPLGQICELSPVKENGKTVKFEFKGYDPIEKTDLETSKEDLTVDCSSRTDLAPSQRLDKSAMDLAVKVAMGDQSLSGTDPKLCTAGITNTASSPGINVAHPKQLWHLGNGAYTEFNPIVSHDRMDAHILKEPGCTTINCTVPPHISKEMIDTQSGLDAVMDQIVAQCEEAVDNGATTLHLDFIDGANIPLFPRELLVYKISTMIVQKGFDGFSDPSRKVNLIASTHMKNHAQDAYTLMAAGLDAVYFPHMTGSKYQSYKEALIEQRQELMTLSMRAGITRLSQLSRSGLYYYQYVPELAEQQYVVNRGGYRFGLYDALSNAQETMLGVASDRGTNRLSPVQRMNPELAMLMKQEGPKAKEVAERRLAYATHSPTIMVPTEHSSLKKTVVVFGAGAAGVSAIEALDPNLYNIIWVESDELNRGGNAKMVSGDHRTMYEGLQRRAQACLERDDVAYCGGLRRSAREALLKNADKVIDCRGSSPVAPPEHFVSVKAFLGVAYAGAEALSNEYRDFPIQFKEERKYKGVFFLGHGETCFDAVKAYFGEDPRSEQPSRMFGRWKNRFVGHALFLTSRGLPESTKWGPSQYHEINEIAQRHNAGELRLFASKKESLPSDLQQYWHPLLKNEHGVFDLPTDGVNVLFETSVGDYHPETGNVDLESQGNGVTLPYIGLCVQGYDPVKQNPPIGDQHGWATGKSSSMAGIAASTETYVPEFDLGHLSIEERRDRLSIIGDILNKSRYVGNALQLAVVKRLIEDPDVSDTELVEILSKRPSEDAKKLEEGAAQEDVPGDSAAKSYDHLFEGIEALDGKMPIILENPDGDAEVVIADYSPDDTVLTTIARQFKFSIAEELSCRGEGSCSECTTIFSRAKRIPTITGRESALVMDFAKKHGTEGSKKVQARTSCQILARPTVVASGSFLGRLIGSKRGLHTAATAISWARRIR